MGRGKCQGRSEGMWRDRERGEWEKIIVSKRGECLIGKGNGT